MSLPTSVAGPAQGAVVGEHDLVVRGLRQLGGARLDLAGQRLLRGGVERLGLGRVGGRGGREHESVEPADHMALDRHFARLSDFGFQHRVLSQPPHQHAGAAIDEAFGQPLMQRIGQLVLDRAGDPLPMLRVGEPVRAVGDESPGPDMRDPVGEGVDVAVGSVGLRHLAGKPVDRGYYPPASGIHRGSPPVRHGWRARSCDSREPGRRPTTARRLPALCASARTSSSRAACSKTRMSSAVGARVRPCSRRRHGERCLQGADRGKIEIGIAPLQHADRLECVAFQRLHQFRLERVAAAGGAEGAVARRPPGAAGDLRQFGRIELAELVAVELAVAGEGDVIDVEIEPHADGVGGDEVIDIAGLVKRDLGVARARHSAPSTTAAPPRWRRINSAMA